MEQQVTQWEQEIASLTIQLDQMEQVVYVVEVVEVVVVGHPLGAGDSQPHHTSLLGGYFLSADVLFGEYFFSHSRQSSIHPLLC